MSSKARKLQASIVKIGELQDHEIEQMFRIYEKYYGGASYANFSRDLAEKSKAILLRNSEENIKGFSTILNYEFELDGKDVQGIFSGDTIIEREYWGGSSLQMAFIKNMFMEKMKRPFSPLYWFLISKGYKTYLLMANNFKEHYPRYEIETPSEIREIMDSFARNLYPDNYDPESGLIKFEETHDHLKGSVAPITRDMCEKNKRIDFFNRTNSSWEEGSELVCLAQFDLGLPFRYGLKAVNKQMKTPLKVIQKGALPLKKLFT